MSQKAYDIKVFGKVQRIGYRRFILENAQELGLIGFVRNEADGSVTVFVQGEESLIEQFLKRIKEPPRPAIVKSLEAKPAEVNPDLKFFTIEFGSLAEELQEGFGSVEKEFRDYREEFRNYRQEFRDYRQEFRSFVGEFGDYRKEFRDYRQEFRNFAERTDKNFENLAQKYGEISEKLTQVLETLQKESAETRKELIRAVDALTELIKQFIAKQSFT
ncbi:MAG: acylphosphatase [Candidatus Bathyarchaeota archaeon]|nr:acylphosphatase [Candidatus Bathyarchaeota archaeon]